MRDPLFAPADVRDRHLHDQLLELFWHGRTSFSSRLPPPKQTKPFPVPADERIGLHDDEGVSPLEELSQGHHREPSGVICAARCLLALDKERELFPEKEIPERRGRYVNEGDSGRTQGRREQRAQFSRANARTGLSGSKATSPMTGAAKRPILAGLNCGINVGSSFCGAQGSYSHGQRPIMAVCKGSCRTFAPRPLQ